jgi:hypothetical protein
MLQEQMHSVIQTASVPRAPQKEQFRTHLSIMKVCKAQKVLAVARIVQQCLFQAVLGLWQTSILHIQAV